MFLYLNYAAVYPYTGGEIVYVRNNRGCNVSLSTQLFYSSARSLQVEIVEIFALK